MLIYLSDYNYRTDDHIYPNMRTLHPRTESYYVLRAEMSSAIICIDPYLMGPSI